jgi:hypothetical protein
MNKTKIERISLLCLIFLVVTVHAETTWKQVKIKDDIIIYSLQKPNYKLKHYKAETLIKKDSDTILAALQDTEACSEWVYNCISNNMVDMSDVRKRIYHTIIHSPLWFKDRDFYLQSHVTYEPEEKLFTISFVSIPEHSKASNDQVRISQVEMIWSLKHISDDMTSVTYQVYIDPKLPIKTINHAMIKKSIYQTMLGLIKLVEKPIYATTKYSESELEMLTEDY